MSDPTGPRPSAFPTLPIGFRPSRPARPTRSGPQTFQGRDGLARTGAVRALVGALPERERQVLHMRFFESMTQSQIAERIGVSQMQVSRILSNTLRCLRDQLE